MYGLLIGGQIHQKSSAAPCLSTHSTTASLQPRYNNSTALSDIYSLSYIKRTKAYCFRTNITPYIFTKHLLNKYYWVNICICEKCAFVLYRRKINSYRYSGKLSCAVVYTNLLELIHKYVRLHVYDIYKCM